MSRAFEPAVLSRGSSVKTSDRHASSEVDASGETTDSRHDDAVDVGLIHPEVTFRIASMRGLRVQAYRLAYDTYTRCGYQRPNRFGMRLSQFDLLDETVTFVACLRNTVIASVTLVRDSAIGLPMEKVYHGELDALRGMDRRLAEATALSSRRRDPRRGFMVFLGLTRLLAHYARHVGMDDLVIAVNPRHRAFYEQTLQFAAFGPERTYESVQNMPAVAFRLDLKELEAQRTFNPHAYSHYFGAEEGMARALSLSEARRSQRERAYFAAIVDEIENGAETSDPAAEARNVA